MIQRIPFVIACLFAASIAAAQTPSADLAASPRWKVEATEPLDTPAGQALKVVVSLTHLDPKGVEQTAKAKLLLPPVLAKEPTRRVPLLHVTGYEAVDAEMAGHLSRGVAVVTPLNHPLNPLSRTPNLDCTLLRIARSLPIIDDTKVALMGGSAGGYTALMVAADSFPLSVSIANVPPINWGYNCRYFMANRDRVMSTKDDKGIATAPILNIICTLAPQFLTYYPADFEDAAWLNHSPIAHLDTITCPVHALFSTADVLVPINQVSAKLAQPFDKGMFPAGYQVAPAELMSSAGGRGELLAALGATRYSLTIIKAEGWPSAAVPPPVVKPIVPLPVAQPKPWQIVILDEGPIHRMYGHFGHWINPDGNAYLYARFADPISPDQLTPKKLERLMAKYAGVEWLPAGLRRLDTPEAERADVLRGLRTFAGLGDRHSKRLVELYSKLPSDRQALGPASELLTTIRR